MAISQLGGFMIPSRSMSEKLTSILCIAGPTASGKSARAVAEALAQGGEVISVDSRQVYQGLDIGTEKIPKDEMRGVPHHLIDIRNAVLPYSAHEFVQDASRIIGEVTARGKLPILAGGTHFYFDALLHGLPQETPPNEPLRRELEALTSEELYARVQTADPRRAAELDPYNRRRLVRALEIIAAKGTVPARTSPALHYEVEWIIVDQPMPELRERINRRLHAAFERGLIEEVARVRGEVGDARLNELGLEYRVVGEYVRGERTRESLMPALSAKLAQLARRQKAWLRKLSATRAAAPPPGRS